jgi:hexosaminidase
MFLFQFSGYYGLLNSTSESPQVSPRIQWAVKRAQQTIFSQGYVPWKFHPRNSNFEPDSANSGSINSISLQQTGSDPANILKPLAGEVDESYSLKITVDGDVTISAPTSTGLVYGLVSFTQLFYQHSEGGAYTPYAPVEIEDKPKFQHRGLNMDLARAWFSPQDVRKQIDALAYNKMNRLHLHITDSQSWPLDIPSMPELSAKGAYNAKLVYSPKVLEELQYYGALQGVEVYIEIDMPGHTSSIWYSHPELIASFNIQPNWSSFAAEPPSGTLKLNDTNVYNFVEKLFKDLLPRVAPFNAYFHTGGDEVNANAYTNDNTVKSSDVKILQPLMQKFIDHSHTLVRNAGLTPMVWEEMLLQWNLTLGADVVVQTWQSNDAVAQTVAAGHKALVGNYEYWVSMDGALYSVLANICTLVSRLRPGPVAQL